MTFSIAPPRRAAIDYTENFFIRIPIPHMAHIVFAPAIQRHVASPARDIAAATVRSALDAVFGLQPELRGYILDDQAQLRRHLAIFVDGRAIADRCGLGDALRQDSRVYVVQALSGG